MKKHIESLMPDTFYHIYNRGINGENIFKCDQNYRYFLNKFRQYVNPIANIYCYCLLSNHFHFLIKTKTEVELRKIFNEEKYVHKPFPHIVSKQFSNFFNGYAQAFNKMFLRTGGLFEEPFRRKSITNDEYLVQIILYIHLNPVRHKLTKDYQNFPYSSFKPLLFDQDMQPVMEEITALFGGRESFVKNHQQCKPTFLRLVG